MNINNINGIKNKTSDSTFSLANEIVKQNYDYIKPTYSYNEITSCILCDFTIPSLNRYKEYKTNISFSLSGNIKSYSCSCKTYSISHFCEHVCAAIIILNNEKKYIYDYLNIKEEKNINPLIESFKSKNKVKEKLSLSLELIKESIRQEKGYYEINIQIGSYVLKKNINEFFEIYYLNQGSLVFGKNFIYNPQKYYFSDDDRKLLDILPLILTEKVNYGKSLYSIDNNYLSTYSYKSKMLFDYLKILNKSFILSIDGVSYEIENIKDDYNPIIDIIKDDDKIDVSIDINDIVALTDDYSYIFLNDNIYYLDNNKSKIIKSIKENDSLEFSKDEINDFNDYVLPKLRMLTNNIDFSKDISDVYNINKPIIKLYFDTYEEGIKCNIKCYYDGIELDVLDDKNKVNDITIVRDVKEEDEAKKYIYDFGFYYNNQEQSFCLDDEDLIVDFIDYKMSSIDKYEVFVTDNLKEAKYIKKVFVKSSFSLEKGELLKCNIELDGIDNDEIEAIMESIKYKKKYFKLKNGSYLNLESCKELSELNNMLSSLNIDINELDNNEVKIPKYKALYINSKLNENSFISVDDAFKEFVNNYKSAINKEIILPEVKNTKLRDYQELGVKWLLTIADTNFGGILADEMGLGKTLETIMFIKKRLEEDRSREILIVSPTSLIYNWESEFKKYAPDIKVKVIAEPRKKREKIFDELKDYEVFITSYGLLREDIEKYKTVNYDTMIIDEAQTIKNVNALITKSVKEIHANTKIALTGTPIENSIIELYSIFDFIMPGFFGSKTKFEEKYGNVLKEENESVKEDFLKLIKPFILRRKKKDVIKELPDKIEDSILIDLSTDEKKLYLAEVRKITDDIKTNMRSDSFNKNKMMILQELTRLRQLCISPSLFINDYDIPSSKITSLVELIESAISENHKLLVFSQFTSALSIVKKELMNKKIQYYYLDGSTKSEERLRLVNEFNKNNVPVFLISLKAGGNGLNLTGADIVIHLDPWWNPAVEDQATSRAHRIGQKHVVQVIKLIAKGTIEEKILKLQGLKKDLSNQIIEGKDRDKFVLKDLSEDDLLYLLENE